jgi:hypothetical protein
VILWCFSLLFKRSSAFSSVMNLKTTHSEYFTNEALNDSFYSQTLILYSLCLAFSWRKRNPGKTFTLSTCQAYNIVLIFFFKLIFGQFLWNGQKTINKSDCNMASLIGQELWSLIHCSIHFKILSMLSSRSSGLLLGSWCTISSL